MLGRCDRKRINTGLKKYCDFGRVYWCTFSLGVFTTDSFKISMFVEENLVYFSILLVFNPGEHKTDSKSSFWKLKFDIFFQIP